MTLRHGKDEWVEIDLDLDEKLADEFNKKTKQELIEVIIAKILKNHVQTETISRLETEIEMLQTKLNTSNIYFRQAQAMIEAAMERWDQYDM